MNFTLGTHPPAEIHGLPRVAAKRHQHQKLSALHQLEHQGGGQMGPDGAWGLSKPALVLGVSTTCRA